MISKNHNLTDYSEEASLPTHHGGGCNFWISARKYLKPSTTTASSSDMSSPNLTNYSSDDLLPTPIQFRCVCNFWNSIHKFARKHFKRSTTTTTGSDPSSANPNILPTLPFDLITEILSRLPVKLLLQLRCVCKSWNSLISHDHKFAKKQLTHSTTHSIYSLGFFCHGILTIYPPNSFLNTAVCVKQLSHLSSRCIQCILAKETDGFCNCILVKDIVGSCNGLLCVAYREFIKIWNPSIHKLKELPLLPEPHYPMMAYGFGYDSLTDQYKVVVVSWEDEKTQVRVNTLGTNIWKNIDEFPFGTVPDLKKSGKYLSGTINWLASSRRFIVSLDLANESYQKLLLPPDYGEVDANSFLDLTLDVFRDCLCIICEHDVWLMKEYGKKESWTKLFTISYKHDPSLSFFLEKVIYVFEDGQVLLQMNMPFVYPFVFPQLILYDPRIATFKFVTFQKSFFDPRSAVSDVSNYGGLVSCIESLISPCY